MNNTKIKICGLTRAEDISAVNTALPDYIGFVFAPSRRQVSAERAEELKKQLDRAILAVGVFVNSQQAYISALINKGIIDAVQLHGDEDEDYIERLTSLTDKPIIKAVSVTDIHSVSAWNDTKADFLLLDNGSGGTGNSFNWSYIKECGKPFFLAGGINSDIINEALKIKPYCIDISSGAETDDVKDREKILRLTKTVHGRNRE